METTLKKYRFKTEAEFEFFYGSNWRTPTQWNKRGKMDHLFGKKCILATRIPLRNINPRYSIGQQGEWHIYPNMLLTDIESRYLKLNKLTNIING